MFRVVQEALANVVKHSGVSNARVFLSRHGEALMVRVEDSGRGFDPNDSHLGLGLVSMRERVGFVDGDIFVRSSPDGGTIVEARIPIRLTSPEGQAITAG